MLQAPTCEAVVSQILILTIVSHKNMTASQQVEKMSQQMPRQSNNSLYRMC